MNGWDVSVSSAGPFIAMAIGIVGTSIIHLSKGVMRHGITKRSTLVYTAGVLMNFTNPLWVILANRFAPTVFYTSMYGLGLVPLLLFSRKILDERLEARQYRGVAIIVFGTLVIGAGNILGGKPSLFTADRRILVLFALGWLLAAPIGSALMRRTSVRLQEYFFGIAAGGMAAVEAVVKGVAQAGPSVNTFLPQTSASWWLFATSFIGAAGAFGMIQWSFLRRCRASMMGALYDVAYVVLPLILSAIIVDGAAFGVWSIIGIGLLVAGIHETVGGHPVTAAA